MNVQKDQDQEEALLLKLLAEPATMERGFRLLVRDYGQRLYAYLRRMLTWHEDADEALQLVWIKVFKNINRFRGESRFYTWLYRIATNEALTLLEKRKRQTHEPDTVLEQRLQSDPFFDGDQVQLCLQQAIENLPPKQRQVFVLRYFDEMPYKDIAVLLQTSEGALKASYHHAAQKVADFVKKKLY